MLKIIKIKQYHILIILYILIYFHRTLEFSPHPFNFDILVKNNQRCPENCLKCSGIFGDICIQCKSGYYITSTGDCKQCYPTCQECHGPFQNTCTSCSIENELYLINGQCQSLNRQLQTKSIILPQNGIDLTNGIMLCYQFNNLDNEDPTQKPSIDMYITYQGEHWIGLGFGTSMSNSDMIIMEIIANSVFITDRYSFGYDYPSKDTDIGGTNDVELIEYSFDSANGTIIHFKRLLNTGDKYDYTIAGPSIISLMWAYSPQGQLHDHTDGGKYAIVTAELVSTNNDNPDQNGPIIKSVLAADFGGNQKTKARFHGISQFVIWGVLFEIATIPPRYLRHIKYYNYYHITLFSIIFGLHIASSIIGFDLKRDDKDSITYTHYILGIITLASASVSMLGGFILQIEMIRDYGTYKWKFMRHFHLANGILLSFITKANLVLGAYLANKYKWWWYGMLIWIGIILIIRIMIELLYRTCWNKNINEINQKFMINPNKLNEDQKELISLLNLGVNRNVIKAKLPKLKWILLGDKIIDVTHYWHPGGNYILYEAWGQEISRYFFGGHELESKKTNAHHHSSYAFNRLQSLIIGRMTLKDSLLIIKDKSSPDNKPFPKPELWNIVNIKNLSPNIFKIEFLCDKFNIPIHLKGNSWMARHFVLYDCSKPHRQRPYTTIMCMRDDNIKIRKAILDFINDIEVLKTSDRLFITPIDIKTQLNNTLPLVIKKYHGKNTFSSYVTSLQPNQNTSKIIIEGPYGFGLDLPVILKGRYVILATGTGILPFLDFLNYMMMNSIIEYMHYNNISRNIIESVNVFNEPYHEVFDDSFSLHLYVAFPNATEIIGLDIIKTLAFIHSKFKPGRFIANIKGYDNKNDHYIKKMEKRLDDDTIVDILKEKHERIYVCGTSAFNKTMYNTLRKHGVKSIYIV